MQSEVKELRNDAENVLKLQEDSKLPPGLKLFMGETFIIICGFTVSNSK